MSIGDVRREFDTPIGVIEIPEQQYRYRAPVTGEPLNGDTIQYNAEIGAFVPSSYPASETDPYGLALQWHGVWSDANTPYQKGSVVIEETWLMVANKDTSDRAAPQPQGLRRYVYTGSSPTNQQIVRQLIYGTEYSRSDAYWITGYRIFTVAGNEYEVFTVLNPNTPQEEAKFINIFVADSTGWREFSLGDRPIQSGVTFRLMVIAYQPDPEPATVVANYNYLKPTNPNPALQGQAVQSSKNPELIRFHNLDADGIDRRSALIALQVGDKINLPEIVRADSWSVQLVNADNPDYVSIFVAPSQQSPHREGRLEFTFSITTPQPVTYMDDPNFWSGNAEQSGVFGVDVDYDQVTVNDDAYGADLKIQPASLSPDWDFMAYSNGLGSPELGRESELPPAASSTPPGNLAVYEVTTPSAAWRTVLTKPVFPGTAFNDVVYIIATEANGGGRYAGQFQTATWFDGGPNNEMTQVFKLGASDLGFRTRLIGGDVHYEIRGQNSVAWDWTLRVFTIDMT